jgi:hypothetical protein
MQFALHAIGAGEGMLFQAFGETMVGGQMLVIYKYKVIAALLRQ